MNFQVAKQDKLQYLQKLSSSFVDEESHAFNSFVKWAKSARQKQIAPDGNWSIWLILAGRGWGKTRTGAEDICAFAMANSNVRCGVVAPTRGDLRRVCFEGPSGLLTCIPKECLWQGDGNAYNRSAMEIRLWNGSIIQGYAAIEPDRLRGPQFHRIWADELAAWRYPEAYDQMMFGLRLGEKPQLIITTTPRPTKIISNLVSRKHKDVYLTSGNTFENHENLAQSALDQLKERYDGTRLGRQELYAELLEDIEGALWSYRRLDETRITKDEMPDLNRIVVAIDPAVTNNEDSDETGIIVAGKANNQRYYVIDDVSGRMTPDGWGRTAIEMFYKYQADRIVAEVNNGGDLVERLLRNIDQNVPYTPVRASRGKLVRAEPIAALYEQSRVSHVGAFKQLEEQLCSFSAGSSKSPDRLDALVWALTELSQSSGTATWRIS
jgi:predicted phage terminase large subunit-like protein